MYSARGILFEEIHVNKSENIPGRANKINMIALGCLLIAKGHMETLISVMCQAISNDCTLNSCIIDTCKTVLYLYYL